MATKKEACCEPHHCCMHPCKLLATLMIIFGVIFLLKDLGVWNFWNINWWTVLFLLFGVKMCMIACMKKK
ncbi:hypothetical protein KY359_00750 [Candidatus Woesearchaeota archaeon]|nr:hypothetical protein [Candidatus Woesearchaeota archaeon]